MDGVMCETNNNFNLKKKKKLKSSITFAEVGSPLYFGWL
jgi:hypothetical protein